MTDFFITASAQSGGLGDRGGSPETEPDYLLYQYSDLPRAVDFLATRIAVRRPQYDLGPFIIGSCACSDS
jgi:hypothetical protein